MQSKADRRGGSGERADIDVLLAMAVAEFAAHGYEGMSMRSLADKCGVSTTAIYYHFGSKDELYNEVCRHKFDEITYVMQRQLAKARTAEDKLEVFVSTLFDEWYRDNTLLLLTQRDVITALVSPEHCVARHHYDKLMGLIDTILAQVFTRPLDADFSFTFGALLYGYCTLMNFDEQASSLSVSEFRQHRRQVLLKYSRRICEAMSAPD